MCAWYALRKRAPKIECVSCVACEFASSSRGPMTCVKPRTSRYQSIAANTSGTVRPMWLRFRAGAGLFDTPGFAAAGGRAGGKAGGGGLRIDQGGAVEVPGVAGVEPGAHLALVAELGSRAIG